MASRGKHHSRSDRDSDSMEALKPLVVLVLFGTILYGAYSVVQKGPSSTGDVAANPIGTMDAPAFAPPAMELAPPAMPPAAAPAAPASPVATMPVAPPPPLPMTPPAPQAPLTPQAALTPQAPPLTPQAPPAAPAMPAAAMPLQAAAVAAAAGAGAAAAIAASDAGIGASPSAPTYLAAESAPPPVQESVAAAIPADRPDRYATLPTAVPPAPAAMPATVVAAPASGTSAAFATAWQDAHEKLAAGRYAEALAALSVWYDDPSLGLEESQRLEDLLGQLAGTVVYSQQDLLLPPHVVAPGETLPQIAAALGVSWRLLAKINGVEDPQRLVPGEHLKLIRGPFDAVISVSRRRLSLQLAGNYAGSFPVVVGRQIPGPGRRLDRRRGIPPRHVRRRVGRRAAG